MYMLTIGRLYSANDTRYRNDDASLKTASLCSIAPHSSFSISN